MSFVPEMHDGLLLFASPQFALTEGAMLVLCAARIMYRFGKQRSALYWKGAALVADIISLVGLIGLSAMAGRMLADQDLRAMRNAELDSGMALQSEATNVLGGLCNPLSFSGEKRPTRALAEAADLCTIVHSLGGIYRPDLNWDQKRAAFSTFAIGKPASDVFAVEAGAFVKLIDTYVDAKNKVPSAEWSNTVMTRLTSPWLVFACLALAMLGLALKIAKSGWEFNKERKSRSSA